MTHLGGISGSREPGQEVVPALTGFDPGRAWCAGSIAAARFELRKLEGLLGDEPFGVSKVSVYAADLYALIVAAERYAKGETA